MQLLFFSNHYKISGISGGTMTKLQKLILGICLLIGLTQTVLGATYTVTKTADTNDGVCDADCSLREAIVAAGSTADNDSIEFSATLFGTAQIITLSGTDLIITNNGTLNINGPGADKLTVSGNNVSRVLTNNTGAVTTISKMRITGGNGVSTITTGRGGGVYNNGGTLTLSEVVITGNTAANGGGANNAGTATLNIVNSVISNNTATGAGGGMQNFAGNTLNIINSTISGNTCASTITGGGALQANGTINIANSTISGNTANSGIGGAIYYNGTALTINNSTITSNTATGDTGGLHKSITTNTLNLRNSIIAGNSGTISPDISSNINSLGNNLIGVVGASTGWVAADLLNQNPRISPFGNFGGNGFTHGLLSGSPAINGGQNCVTDLSCATNNPPAALSTDQRGANRAGNVDIGAFEVATFTANLPDAALGAPYSTIISPNNGSFNYSLSSGTLPPGLSLNTNFAELNEDLTPNAIVSIAGTASIAETATFTILVSNGTNSLTTTYRLRVLGGTFSGTVSGRVTSSFGYGVYRARIRLILPNGNILGALTNGFGYYSFNNVSLTTGGTCVITMTAKGADRQEVSRVVQDPMIIQNFIIPGY
jgi:CSLREA domain-containing protein